VFAHRTIMKTEFPLIAQSVLEDVLNVLHAHTVPLVKKTDIFPLPTLVNVMMDIMNHVELPTELLVMEIAPNPIAYHVTSNVPPVMEMLQLAQPALETETSMTQTNVFAPPELRTTESMLIVQLVILIIVSPVPVPPPVVIFVLMEETLPPNVLVMMELTTPVLQLAQNVVKLVPLVPSQPITVSSVLEIL
jgi:hypothetical protein